MDKRQMEKYAQLLQTELVPALGCTEPGAIAFCAASAARLLGTRPEKLRLCCSGSVMKNVHSVAIPNAGGLRGVAAAAVLGALVGDANRGLCVLEAVTPEIVRAAMPLCENGFCACELERDADGLYIRVLAEAGSETAEVTVAGSHTNIVKEKRNGCVVFENQDKGEKDEDRSGLNVRDILFFADHCDLDRIRPILKRQIDENSAIAREGLSGDYGVGVGKSLLRMYDGTDVRVRAKAGAAAGSDARMSGCLLPVVINSGSGNQGIAVCVPVVEYANEMKSDRDTLYRALALANLIAILQKRTVGNLSAFCGAVHAAAGAACGVAYLMGGGYEDLSNIITYTLATIGGMVCDGAKASCAAKICQAVDTALLGMQLSMREHRCFHNGEGLVKGNVEETVNSFGRMARDGMRTTNETVLQMMMEA